MNIPVDPLRGYKYAVMSNERTAGPDEGIFIYETRLLYIASIYVLFLVLKVA